MITIQKGNPYDAVLTFTDADGNPYDLTGKTIFFTVKNKDDDEDDDTDAIITNTITVHTDPTGGISALALDADDTDVDLGDYKADFRVYKSSPLVQLNTLTFDCTVINIVSKRTS